MSNATGLRTQGWYNRTEAFVRMSEVKPLVLSRHAGQLKGKKKEKSIIPFDKNLIMNETSGNMEVYKEARNPCGVTGSIKMLKRANIQCTTCWRIHEKKQKNGSVFMTNRSAHVHNNL